MMAVPVGIPPLLATLPHLAPWSGLFLFGLIHLLISKLIQLLSLCWADTLVSLTFQSIHSILCTDGSIGAGDDPEQTPLRVLHLTHLHYITLLYLTPAMSRNNLHPLPHGPPRGYPNGFHSQHQWGAPYGYLASNGQPQYGVPFHQPHHHGPEYSPPPGPPSGNGNGGHSQPSYSPPYYSNPQYPPLGYGPLQKYNSSYQATRQNAMRTTGL